MGLFSFLKRDNTPNPIGVDDDDDEIAPSTTGVRVTPDTALKSGVAYACMRVVANSLGSLPLVPYKNVGKNKEVDREHELFWKLRLRPNPYMTATNMWRQVLLFLLMRGNAYIELVYKKGTVSMFLPRHPDQMSVTLLPSGEKQYKYRDAKGGERIIASDKILHFIGPTLDGITGIGVVDYVAKQAIGLSMAQEEYSARSFGRRANIAGILKHPGKLDDAAHDRIKKSWQDAYGGLKNSHKVAITEEGMEFSPISMTNEAAQFLESRRFQNEEICRIFCVPPHKVQDYTNAHYNNVEYSNTEFWNDTLAPWATVIEQELNWVLIGPEPKDLEQTEIKFDFRGLLRGDSKTRAEVQNMRLNNGMQSVNEARAEEDWNPVDNGDIYREPLNMKEAGTPDPVKPAEKPKKEPVKAKRDLERVKYAYIRSFEDVFGRICRREAAEMRNFHRKKVAKDEAGWALFIENWSQEYAKLSEESLRSLTLAWTESLLMYRNLADGQESAEHELQIVNEFVSDMCARAGQGYADGSRKRWQDGMNQKEWNSWEGVAEEIERDRPRKEAERCIALISEQFDSEIEVTETGRVVRTVKENKTDLRLVPKKKIIKFGTADDGKPTVEVTEVRA